MRLHRLLARFITLTCALIALCSPSAQAQVSASMKGVVTDASGAAVTSATVTAKNLETGAVRISVTDDAGRYLVLALPVGEYQVRVGKVGFRDAVRYGIRLVVAQEASIDLQMQVGGVTSEILVKGDAPI